MRSEQWACLCFVLCSGVFARAQTTTTPAVEAGAAGSQGSGPPSALVQPSLGTVAQSLEMVFVDRWKTSKALKETTTANLGSIHRDLETTLPGLLAAADGVPASAAGMVPASQNLGALYDVLLRVTVVAESAAPAEQTAALERALTSLEGARRAYTERLQGTAEAEDRQLTDLQSALHARPAPAAVAAAPVPCKPVPATKKKSAKPGGSPGN